MGCKEVMVTAPILVLLYDRTFVACSFAEALRRRKWFYIALAATWVILARQAIGAFAPQEASAGFGMASVTPLAYARTELGVVLHYLALSFWPARLCLDYGWPIARTAREILPGALMVGGLLAATLWALARRPIWGFIGAWFFLILAPTSSFMPIADRAFEHRMYLPLAAVISAAVFAAYAVARNRNGRLIAVCAALAAASALGWATFRRNADYRTVISIWEDTAGKRPQSYRANIYLGEGYLQAGRYADALRCCNMAVQAEPREGEAYADRAMVHIKLREFELAISDCDTAIRLQPRNANAWNNRAAALLSLGRFEPARRDCDEAVRLAPEFAMAHFNRGNLFTDQQQYEPAVPEYDTAIRLAPNYADAYHNRAVAHYYLKHYDQAWADLAMCQKLGGPANEPLRQALIKAMKE